jgi:hypothetical protein
LGKSSPNLVTLAPAEVQWNASFVKHNRKKAFTFEWKKLLIVALLTFDMRRRLKVVHQGVTTFR